MTLPPGLDLLAHLLIDHQVDRGGAPLLIPCLHEELDQDIDLLRAGARRCGGTLFHLNDDDASWEAPPGPVVRDRVALLEGLWAAATDALPSPIELSESQTGGVTATVADEAPEPSLQLILRCAAVLASSALDAHELVIITVDVAGLDSYRRQLLWRMLTIEPADFAIRGAPTTLVPIFGTRVDPDLDYRRPPAVRYVVRWDRVIRRSTTRNADAIHSIGAPNRGPLVLFLGAGASASANIPLGNSYRDLALTELVGAHPTAAAAADTFFDYLHEHQRFMSTDPRERATFTRQLTLERVLRETFNSLGYRSRASSRVVQTLIEDCAAALQQVRPGRRALRKLAAELAGRLIIVTVNFDELIETDLGVDTSVYYLPEHFRERLSDLLAYARGEVVGPLPVLKLHGSIQDPETLIATIDKTAAGLHADVRTALDELLRVSATPLTWVWVGCSMRDRDMNLWLGGRGAEAFDEWWVDPLPGQALDDFFQQQRAPKWTENNRNLEDRLIVDSADRFLTALADRVSRG